MKHFPSTGSTRSSEYRPASHFHYSRAMSLRSSCALWILVACGGGHGASEPDASTTDAAGGLAIEPAAYTVPIDRSMTFVATGAATWSVTEPGGGTVDANGVYQAPSIPGTYHLVASVATQQATATITVADFQLSTLAGQLGGGGHADGIGDQARFDQPSGIAGDGAGNLYIADSQSATIRKLVIATGAVTTIAGAPNQPGDEDGIGSAARFEVPLR